VINIGNEGPIKNCSQPLIGQKIAWDNVSSETRFR
jgi:hypothetical protein